MFVLFTSGDAAVRCGWALDTRKCWGFLRSFIFQVSGFRFLASGSAFGLRCGRFDVLGLEAHADEASGEVLEAGDVGEDAEQEWRGDRAAALEDAYEHAVGEDLDALRVVHHAFAVVLDLVEMMDGEGVGAEGFVEDVGCGYGVLEGDVDADAADGGHGVGGVSDAE